MPYTAEHKEKTRARIVDSARALFNRKGFVEVSIDEIMAHAGLTRGGFYSHFETKEDLFVEAIAVYGRRNPADRWDDVELDLSCTGSKLASEMINAYLSRAHLDDITGHCPLIALPSDVARASSRVKEAYRGLLEGMAGMFAAAMPNIDAAPARERGLALAALCVGGMVLARTFEDASFSNQIREAVRAMALENLG
jgi:TetR/AcrR family transcriptional regulator, transcriptional repressor for nem operon